MYDYPCDGCESSELFEENQEVIEKVEELKDIIWGSIKDDFKSELERLKKENAELKDIKLNWARKEREVEETKRALEREYSNKKYELDRERSKMESQIRKVRLAELLQDVEEKYWGIHWRHEDKPKCEKCDSDRRIYFINPLGEKDYVRCTCSKSIVIYEPKELTFYKYVKSTNKYNLEKNGYTLYKINYSKNWEEDTFTNCDKSFDVSKLILTADGFEELNQWDSLTFATKELAQAYCDYKNSKGEL